MEKIGAVDPLLFCLNFMANAALRAFQYYDWTL